MKTPFRSLFVCSCMALFLSSSCNFGPKTKDIKLTYLVKDGMRYERTPGFALLDIKPKMKAWVTVTNTSDYNGVFRFNASISSQGNIIQLNAEEFIPSGGTVKLMDELEINHHSFGTGITANWEIVAPIKTIELR